MGRLSDEVAIVGGGLGGLAAAVQLGRLGLRATLFEQRTELGGRARTDRRHGFHLNAGPHRLFERGAALAGLRELSVAVDPTPRGPGGGFAIWRGARHTLPVGCCSLATTDLVDAAAKRELARVLAAIPMLDVSRWHRMPIAEWLRIHVTDPHVIQMIRAMVRATTYSDDAERQSASAALDQLKLSLTGAVMLVHEGWGTMIAALQRAARSCGIAIVTGRRVVAMKIASTRASGVELDDGTTVACGSVIVATAPRQAAELLPPHAVALPSMGIRAAVLDVALRHLPNPRAVFAVGIDEPVHVSADSAVARVAPGPGAVVHAAKCLRSGVAGSPADEQQLERVLDLLQPGWRDLIVYRRFAPAMTVSHALVEAAAGGFTGRQPVRLATVDNVFLAGDWVGPEGQLADASVASGIAAARAAHQFVAAPREHYAAQ